MATVTTPTGDVLEGVTGALLDYYRGEGYEITDEEQAASQDVAEAPVDDSGSPADGDEAADVAWSSTSHDDE